MVRSCVLLWLLLCAASPAAAQTLYRCTDEAGTPIYTDRPCEHVGAIDAPTIARDPALTAELAGTDTDVADIVADTGAPRAAQGCPGPDPQHLRDAAVRAIARRDINALTGMYHWPGAGSASGVIGRLQQLIDAQPHRLLLEAPAPDDGWLWAGQPPPDARDALPELHAYKDDTYAVARFRLVRNAGCVWLSR